MNKILARYIKYLRFDNILETLLSLLENKETIIQFPLFTSCIFVFLMYSQAVGFIAQTETIRKLNESQIIFFGHWNEYSPGTYLLLITGNDSLSVVFFTISQLCLYIIIIYIIFRTIQKVKQNEQNKNQTVSDTPLSKIVNKVIQLFIQSFFSVFLWIFYVPFAEISSGLSSCSKFGFITTQRKNCDNMPIIQMIFAVLGAVITLMFGLIINKFYVSYDFLDPNYLKRRYRANQNISLFCKSAMIFIFYQDLPIYFIKYGFSHVFGLNTIYDWMRYLPFVNKSINIVYGTIAFIYYSIILLYNLWEVWPDQPIIKEYNIFYIWVMMWPFFYGFVVMYIERFYEQLLTITPFQENIDKADFIDYYLEEIYRLSENSKNNIKDKIKLQGIMQNYYNIFKEQGQSDIDNLYNKILDENNEPNKEVITQIINQLFVKFLDHIKTVKRIKVQRQELMEHLSLKYFLFLANKQDNPVQAYFQIKKMNRKQDSNQASGKLYINAIKIVCDGLERKIVLKYRSWGSEGNSRSFNYNNGFENIHKYKMQQIKCLVEITNTKHEFWQKLCEGFTHMETFWNDTYQKSSNLIRLKRQFETLEMVLSSNPELKDNVIILKLQSLFASLLLNSDVSTMKQEAKISQILKSDSSQIKNSINSQTILEGKSVMLTGSMLLNEGEIIHPVTERTAQFFGYKDSDEFSKQVIKIEQLLTDGLAAKHTLMIKKFVKTGKTSNIQKERLIQFVDKQGFMNQGQIFYTFNFENKGDFCINSMITSINPENQCLIFTKTGKLERIQKVFFDNYIINSLFSFNYLQNNDCRMVQLEMLKSGIFFPMFIPQLLSYINDKNTSNIYNDKTYILIPKNILSFLQNFLIVIDHYIQQEQEQDFPEFTSIKKIKSMAEKHQKDGQDQRSKKQKKYEDSSTTKKNRRYEDMMHSKNSNLSKIQMMENAGQDIDCSNYMSQLPILCRQLNSLKFSIKNDKHRDYLNYFLEEYLFNLEENYTIYMGNVNLRLQQFNQPETPEHLEQYLLYLTDVQEISIQQYNQLIQQEHGANQLQQKMKKQIGQQIQTDLNKKENSYQDLDHKENNNADSFNLYSDLNSVEELDEEQRFLKENKNFKRFNSDSQQEEDKENSKKIDINQNQNIQKDIKDVSVYSLNVNDMADDKDNNMQYSYNVTKEAEPKDDYSDMKNFSAAEIDLDENQLIQEKQLQQQNQTNAGSSYGLDFVTDIVTNKKKIKLTRNIAILSYLQLIFFISINVGYLMAIQDQINTFQNKFNNILSIDGGLYSYSQTLYGQLFGRLLTENKIVGADAATTKNYKTIQRQLLMDSHKWLRETLKTKDFFKEQILIRHIDIYNVNNDNSVLVDKRNLFQLLNYIETQLFQKENNYQSGTTNPYLLQQQMTIQMNFDQFQSQIRDLQNNYNQEIIEQKTQFLNFYISISICGFIMGLALQMINMPLVYSFQNYIERVLMLLARISEREAKNECVFFMNCSKILKKNNEIYLLKTFTHSEKDQEQDDINQASKKGNKNANTSYLSNKIQNPKLNRVKNFGLNFITLLSVGIYFSVFFVLIKTLTDKLEYSVSLNDQQKEFKMNMMMADLLAPIIITSPFTKAKDFKKNVDSIGYQRKEFEKAFNYLKTVETQFSVFFSDEMPSSSREKLRSLLNTNEGYDKVGFEIIKDKTSVQDDYIKQRFKKIYETNFKYGFLGMNQQTQSTFQTLFTNIMGQNAVDQALMTKYYGEPETVIDLMSNYQVKTQLQRKFTQIVNDGIVQIMNELNNTFIIVCGLGGGICATLLMIVILYFYSQLQQQMESARFALVLIPIKKLQEDATMHLLKKLDNI